ncbi:MAG: hypothetical protein EBY41_00810 [Proteobacteria bacterium]|nr:hypothetical protein [Pseudomonadota bacterium]
MLRLEMKNFISVGPGKFRTCEDLLQHGYRGIFIEPVKELLDDIRSRVSWDNAEFDNCILAAKNSEYPFYQVVPHKCKNETIKEISHVDDIRNSFYRIPNMAETGKLAWHIDSSQPLDEECLGTCKYGLVPSKTLDKIIDDYWLSEIDLLQVTVNGYELAILGSYSWRIKPEKIIVDGSHINHNHLLDLLSTLDYNVSRIEDRFYASLR